jgi:hypothetical protein
MRSSSSVRLAALAIATLLAACAQVPGSDSDFAVAGKAAPAAAPVAGKGVRMAGGYYEGAMRNGVPEGHGIFRYDDGRRYEGQFAAGRFNGAGKMQYPDGRRVEAQFRGDFEDTGMLTYPDGRVFEGQLQKGVPQGKGTMRMNDGSRVTGAFQNGRAEGRALQTKADGSTYFGPFSGGMPQGGGVCSGPGGSSFCNKSGNSDTTAQELRKIADQRAAKAVEDAARAEREKMEREAAERRRPEEQERDRLQAQRRRESGPENDPECSCQIGPGCIIVKDARDTTPPEVARAQWERSVLMCRNKYATWLNLKADPNYSKKMAELDGKLRGLQQKLNQEAQERRQRQQEIDARFTKLKSDEAERNRMRQAELAKEQAERDKKLDEAKKRCGDPQVLQANPCRCRTLLKLPDPKIKGAVCEA